MTGRQHAHESAVRGSMPAAAPFSPRRYCRRRNQADFGAESRLLPSFRAIDQRCSAQAVAALPHQRLAGDLE